MLRQLLFIVSVLGVCKGYSFIESGQVNPRYGGNMRGERKHYSEVDF